LCSSKRITNPAKDVRGDGCHVVQVGTQRFLRDHLDQLGPEQTDGKTLTDALTMKITTTSESNQRVMTLAGREIGR
jgi:hypothetical protein